jgi:hypothetical protein
MLGLIIWALLGAVDAAAGQAGGGSQPFVNPNPLPDVGNLNVVTYNVPDQSPGSLQQVIVSKGQGDQSGTPGNLTGLQVQQQQGTVQKVIDIVNRTPGVAAVFTLTPGHQITYINQGKGTIIRPGLP